MSNDMQRDISATSPMCLHHWVIETPNGARSHGFCKRCGTERDFRNSSEDMQWDNDNFNLGGSRGRRGNQGRAQSVS